MNAGRFIGIIVFLIGIVFMVVGVATLESGDNLRSVIFFAPSLTLVGLVQLIFGSGKVTVREMFERDRSFLEVCEIPSWQRGVVFLALIGGMGISFLYIHQVTS